MTNTTNAILAIKNRIFILEERDAVRNNAIIKKLKRKLRKLEGSQNDTQN